MGSSLFGYDPESYSDWSGFFGGENYSDPLGLEKERKKKELEAALSPKEPTFWEGLLSRLGTTGSPSSESLSEFGLNPAGEVKPTPETETTSRALLGSKRGLDLIFNQLYSPSLNQVQPSGEVEAKTLESSLAPTLIAPTSESGSSRISSGLVPSHGSETLSEFGLNPISNRVKPTADTTNLRAFAAPALEGGLGLAADPNMALFPGGVAGKGFKYAFAPGMIKDVSGAAGELYSQYEQGTLGDDRTFDILGRAMPTALMLAHMGRGVPSEAKALANTIPEASLPGGFSTRSPINLEPSLERGFRSIRELPNYASAMAEGGGKPKLSFIDEIYKSLENDPLLEGARRAREAGVLYNPTGTAPTTVRAFHGTGDVGFAEGKNKILNQDAISEHTQAVADAREMVENLKDEFPGLTDQEAIDTLGIDPNKPGPKPIVNTNNPIFSSRKASSSNMEGGPLYTTTAKGVAEGEYAGGEGGGRENPGGVLGVDVTYNKLFDLEGPKPRDFDIRGRAIIGDLIRKEQANLEQKTKQIGFNSNLNDINNRGFLDPYPSLKDNFKRLQTYKNLYNEFAGTKDARGAKDILETALDSSIGDANNTPYLAKRPEINPNFSAGWEKPLFDRNTSLTPKDLGNRLLQDLGFDTLSHIDRDTGARVYIPFEPRNQAKIREVEPTTALKDRSVEDLIQQLKSTKPDAAGNKVRNGIIGELRNRKQSMALAVGEGGSAYKKFGSVLDSPDREAYISFLEDKINQTPEHLRTDGNTDYVLALDALQSAKKYNTSDYSALKEALKNPDIYEPPTLTPEDYSLLSDKELKTEGLVRPEYPPRYMESPLTVTDKAHLNPTGEGMPKERFEKMTRLEHGMLNANLQGRDVPLSMPLEEALNTTPKAIELGDMISSTSKALGWKPNPFEPTSKAVNFGGETPLQGWENILKEKHGENWENKLTDNERNLRSDLKRGDDPVKSIERFLAAEKKGTPAPLSTDSEVRSVQEAMMNKPAGEMTGKSEPKAESKAAPVEPTKESLPMEEGEKTPAKRFTVTLDDGTTHIVKGKDIDSVIEKVEEILAEGGAGKSIVDIKERPSSLELAASTKLSPREIKAQESLNKAQSAEEIATAKSEMAAAIKAGKSQLKLEGEEVSTGKSEDRLREAAVEKELKDKLKVEENFAKAKEREKSNLTKEADKKAKKLLNDKLAEESSWRNNPIVRALNAAKSLAYGGDVGHLLNQGKQMNVDLLFSKHAKEVVKQFPAIFKAAKSEKFMEDFHKKLYTDPDIKLLVDKFGLDMPGLGKGLKEEVFYGKGLLEDAPVVGKYYAKPSERIYTTGLNFLRAAEVKKYVGDLRARGLTPENAPERYKGVARAINIISQRGDFNPAYQKVFSDASVVFGAPRAKASRVQNLGELFRGGTSPNIARKSAAKMLAFNVAMYGLLKASHDDVSFVSDPERSDFGKIRIGDNVTVDPWIGAATTVRSAVKGDRGYYINPQGKKVRTSLPSEFGQEFFNMLSPGIRAAYEFFRGKDVRGYQVSRGAALSNLLPLSPKEINFILDEKGIEGIILAAMQLGGERIQVFNLKEAKKEEEALKKERGISTSTKKKNSDLYSYPF